MARPGRLPGNDLIAVSIIFTLFLICIPLLLPTYMHSVDKHNPRYWIIKQKAQFHSIDAAIELFNSEFDGYPPSNQLDEKGKPYCGAMKLCETMMGRDLMGFHPNSKFKLDGLDESGALLYDPNTLEARKGPYLPISNGNPYRLKDLYRNVGPFGGNEYVLCDEFWQVIHLRTGRRVGMPVLYYKADTSKTAHDINDPNNPENIYDYRDNHALLALGVSDKPGQKHPLYEDPKIFYEMTRNYYVTEQSKPMHPDRYILLSAGKDGLYGTKDDIANFHMQWKPE